MTTKAQERDSILRGIQVLDGGMATEIEHLGANIDGPLWSAHVLEDAPEKSLPCIALISRLERNVF
jgi:S-methylmethionine-dependent homocysteine/selenocysteine methylase